MLMQVQEKYIYVLFLNLKESKDVELFKTITTETAKLVKKYKGSFSGEHGDGIVRSSVFTIYDW